MVAVLFSSGIDSYACLNWALLKYGFRNVIPIYINFGQRYADKELEHAKRMCELLCVNLHVVKVDGILVENPVTAHVPFRNMIFLQIAAMLENVDIVVFGMVKGDWGEDKNPKFVRKMESMLNSQLIPTIHRKSKKLKIVTPFAHHTKAGVVKWLLKNSRPGSQGVRETIGCYATNEQSCGNCISCFSRWVALYLNGMHSEKPDYVYVQWLVHQMSNRGTASKWALTKLFWKKRAFIFDAHKALNAHCQDQFEVSFINAYFLT